jgi:hypothetical protein
MLPSLLMGLICSPAHSRLLELLLTLLCLHSGRMVLKVSEAYRKVRLQGMSRLV